MFRLPTPDVKNWCATSGVIGPRLFGMDWAQTPADWLNK